jgi:hypothetical protein
MGSPFSCGEIAPENAVLAENYRSTKNGKTMRKMAALA